MRRLICSMFVTLDGHVAGPDGDDSWNTGIFDDAMEEYSFRQLESADTLVLGRRTYEMFAGFWPKQTDNFAAMMNAAEKLVFSRAPLAVDWAGTRRAAGDPVAEITGLKHRAGKDLLVYGSAELSRCLLGLGLVDELRLWVHPVVLGEGKPFLAEIGEHLSLRLVDHTVFDTGVVVLSYRPERKEIATHG